MEAEYQALLEKRYQSLVAVLRGYMQTVDEKRLLDAFEFAMAAHDGQNRRSGEPYIIHPVEVALIIAQLNMDMDSVIAALLHDVIEDTEYTFKDIQNRFGASVAHLVEGVTKLSRVNYTSQEEQQMNNLRKMFMAMAKDIRVILVKIADRLHNMRTIAFQPEKKRREISLETMEIYAPIAHRLGMQRVKWELEDIALQQLDPVGYSEIMREMDNLNAKGSFLDQIQEQVAERLAESGIEGAHIESRIKHVYSLYRKMMVQHKTLSEIYDVYAVRIIVDDMPSCYNVLGLVHALYNLVPGRFKDYISTPKPNMYQSLHTTVIGKEGQPFEIQIRTWEMHQTAEYGIAAHWRYKEGLAGTASRSDLQLTWVRNLLESQQDTEAEDFISNIKHDMFADEVFVFTPQGEVKSLPAGAGPVDFAYSIHSAVGNRLSGAKVNGRIVALDYKLQSGDIVEILTAGTNGPSRDWMRIAKTSEARSKIKQWFKKERREDNIQQGRADMEREFRRAGIPMATALHEDILTAALRKLSFGNLDDMLAAVGYGGVSARRVLGRFREELSRHNRLKQTDESALEQVAAAQAHRKPRKAVSGVIVEGLDNCLIKFARCCAPVPGDKIVGYVTRGYGVSVHRADCQNVHEAITSDAGRRVRVTWAEGETGGGYESSLLVRCHDRSGLVVDVMNALSGFKIKVNSLSAKAADGNVLIGLRLEINTLEQLTNLTHRLSQISSVIEVERKDAL